MPPQTQLIVRACMGYLLALAAYSMELYNQEQQQQERNTQRRERRIAKKKRRAVRAWLRRRESTGQYEKLMRELEAEDLAGFRNYLRMEQETFYDILQRITPRIKKKDSNFRKALPPGLKLAATLRFLATGSSTKSLMFAFRVSHNAICNMIIEVCQAIIDELAKEVIVTPSTPAGWKEVAELFWTRWNFPHCVGAIDGKHVAIRKPRKSGSEWYNYKGFFSIVLLAIVDADYKFMYIDVGDTGAGSDAGVFITTDIKQSFEEGTLGLPPPEPLPGDEEGRPIPYFLVGDDAFGLKPWLMKPLPIRNMTVPQRIFNYRLSRARRIVENAFGILVSRFRCLSTTLQQGPERAAIITTACCVLHNLLRMRNPAAAGAGDAVFNPEEEDPNDDREPPAPLLDWLPQRRGRRPGRDAKEQRQYLVDYVNSEAGSVPWQQDRI